ncbi:MAG: DUF4421 domain-containing protein [Bacteroidetes bacterium]|nr:DUF4421 domain-containing protein [Bacteroidota bacterium]MBU1718256.1 DUF4421 domain-containing protein [Bacteroidota bacterium]
MFRNTGCYLLFLLFFVGYLRVSGQSDSLHKRPVVRFPNKITLHSYFGINKLNLNIEKENNIPGIHRVPTVRYSPNSSLNWGFGASYKNLRLLLSVRIPQNEHVTNKYGSSLYRDYRLYYYTKYVGGEAFFQRYSGLYLDNPGAFDTAYHSGDPFPRRDDISIYTYGVNTYIVGNRDFSLRSAFLQAERQTENAFTGLVMFSYRYVRIENDTSLIPNAVISEYISVDPFRDGYFRTFSIAPGIGLTWVKKRFFFTPIFLLGIGFQHQNYNSLSTGKHEIVPAVKFYIKGSTGYNGDNFYVALQYGSDNSYIPIGASTMRLNSASARLAFGYRL